MKKGLTLLEALITVIIIGVLAIIGFATFKNFSEKARIAEAKLLLAHIREAEINYFERTGKCTQAPADLILELDPSLFLGVGVPGDCSNQNISYFQYGIVCADFGDDGAFYIGARRCKVGGKPPPGTYDLYLKLYQRGYFECGPRSNFCP